jgi:hypothetical protein
MDRQASPHRGDRKTLERKAVPPRIAAAGMHEIQRTGRVPQRVRKRLAIAVESDVSPEATTTEKDSPKDDPERFGKS